MFEDDFKNEEEINIPELVEKLREYSNLYYNGDESPISDEEFDRLKDLLKQVDPNNRFLFEVGSSVKVTQWKKAKHKIPMGSLNKVNTVEEFKHWCQQISCDDFVLTAKLDGISIDLEYENGKLIDAITRGDGIIGESILSNVVKMKNVKKNLLNFTGSLRGEIVIHRDDFIKLNEESKINGDREYKNPRNSSSGIAKNFDGKYAKYCTILYYDGSHPNLNSEFGKITEIISRFKLDTPFWIHGDSNLMISTYQDFENKVREEYPYDIDGLVIAVNQLDKQKNLGFAYDNPKGKIAWKFGAIKKETELIGIDWQVGNNRRITPVAKVKPINICGATITNASLSNVDLFLNLKLQMGDKVLISRRNDVIPFLEEVTQKGIGKKFLPPEKCPECAHPTELDGKYLICGNDNCPALYCGNLFKWLEKLEIMNVSYAFVEKLFKELNVLDPVMLYALTIDNIASIEGLGEKSAEKFLNQLHSKMEIDLPTFIGGLNMANFSTSICEKLMNTGYDTIDKLFSLNVNLLCQIPGIKEKIAGKIINGLQAKKEIIEALLKIGIKIKSTTVKEVNQVSNHLTGIAFVFTGAIEKINPQTGKNYKREELQQMVLERGGINHTSLTKNTTYLVQADPSSQSSKTKKALQYGTKILSEKDFFKMLES